MNTIMNEALIILNDLHFIRADWFYAFIPLFLFLLLAYRQTTDNKNWRGIIDPQLLPFVLSKSTGKRRRYPLLLVFIAGSLCITALAGPVYKKLPQPVYREQSSLVILLDLSQSMNATDIKPSRLARAKLELLDLLKARKAGQTALIVYAADAFVVTPLTDDNATIANLVPALETDMMPAQGSNLAKALAKAFSLFSQSGIVKGDILLITDDVHPRDESAIKKVSSQGHRLSIFGIGTRDGGPIPLDAEAGGGFLQDSHGAIVIPKLQPQKLQRYALTGGGLYTSLQAGDEDVNKLSALFQSSEIAQEDDDKNNDINNLNADVWQEEGHWLLLPLLFLAALWARRGWLAIVLLFILPLPQPAYAATIDSEHLWSSPDQQAMKAFNNGDLEQAAKSFTRPEWKASALYRKGDYEAAAKTLEKIDNSDSQYNRGNALAKQGKLEDALKAYDKALKLDKNNADAQYNREQVKQALEKQKQDQQQNKQQNNQQQDDKKQDGQKDDQKQNDQQKDGQQQDSKQQKDQQNDQQQDSGQKQHEDSQQSDKQSDKQSDGQSAEQSDDKQQNKDEKNQQQSGQKKENKEQQQMEQEQLKQRDAKAEAEQQKKEQQQYQKDQQQDQQDQSAEKHKQQQVDKEVENKDSDEKPMEIEVNPIEASITEEEKATEQWLKRIPDDPGGLLRRKFYYQYKQIPNQTDSEQPW